VYFIVLESDKLITFLGLSFHLSPLSGLLFLVAELAQRCHVSPSPQTKNLPAMKITSEGGRERS
jgi:hypothetical protein